MSVLTHISVGQLRRGLRRVLDYVATKKKPVTITRHGVAVAELYPVDYHPRRAAVSSPSVLPDCALGGCLYEDGRCTRSGQCAARG